METSSTSSAGASPGRPLRTTSVAEPSETTEPEGLRAAPPRIVPSPSWFAARQRVVGPWRVVKPTVDHSPYVAKLQDHYWRGDPLMDRAVELSREIGARPFRDMLDTALDHGIDAVDDPPRELVDLFAQIDHVPYWFDPELAEHGRIVLGNASAYGKLCGLMLAALLTSIGTPVSSAVGSTGQFVRHTARRSLENDYYFWTVSRPGVFDRYAEPFKTNVRVRLMHTQVRIGLSQRWNDEQLAHYGTPISQTDMAAGAVGFGLLPLLYDVAQGRSYQQVDLEAAMMYWGYVGYIFGISDDIRARNVSEAVELLDFILAGQGAPTEWTGELTGLMVDLVRRTISGTGDSALARLLQKGGTLAAGGLAHHVAGEPLAGIFVGNPSGRNSAMHAFSEVIDRAAGPTIRAAALWDRRPGQADRRRERVANGDRLLEWRYRTAKAMAAAEGLTVSTYEGLDAEDDTNFARPSRRPRVLTRV